MENEKKALIKYAKPTIAYWEIGFGLFFIILVISVFSHLSYFSRSFGLILGVVLIAFAIHDFARFRGRIRFIEDIGKMQDVLSDFRSGTRTFNNKLIVGQSWLIGKNTGTIIPYSDITRIYQTIHKTNMIEDSRDLTVALTNKKRIKLCTLKTRNKSSDELDSFFNFLQTEHPDITIGYDREY